MIHWALFYWLTGRPAPGSRWLLVAFLALAAVPGAARADFIVERAALEDPGSRLDIAQAMLGDFQPAPRILAQGFTASTYWLRLTVQAPPRSNGPAPTLALRVLPAYLDDITLYVADPAAAGGWHISRAGDRVPPFAHEDRSTAQTLLLHQAEGRFTVYLRVNTTSNMQVHAQVLTLHEAESADRLHAVLFGIYLGVMLALLAVVLVNLISSRDAALAWFVPFQISNMLFGAAVLGYLGAYLPLSWARHADALTCMVIIATPFFAILSNRALLATQQPARWGLRLLSLMAGVSPLAMLALAAGHARLALLCNALLVLALGPALLAVSLTTRAEGVPRRWVVRVTYGLLCLNLAVAALPALGLTDAVAWRLHSSLIHGLITGLMIFALLQLRSRDLVRSRQQALLALQVARERAEHERLEKEEKTRFLTMLTHELHSPLLVLRLVLSQVQGDAQQRMDALGQSHMRLALHDMEKLIDRCLQADRVEQTDLPVMRQPFQLAPVLADAVDATGQPERFHVSMEGATELRSDETLFRVVIGNLLDNALKYSLDGSAVQLRALALDHAGVPSVRLQVSNIPGGAGMPDAQRVFQKYYRAAGARAQRGTGLGLWLVRAISRHLGGEADLLLDGERVVFQVTLPA